MAKTLYKVFFLKKTAKLNKESIKKFISEILKNFGGISLLSTVSIISFDDSTFEISSIDKESARIANSALSLCGQYQTMKCCIREIMT